MSTIVTSKYVHKPVYGSLIRIMGTATEERFLISLMDTNANNHNFHISIRPKEGYIALNTSNNNVWQKEERIDTMPIRANEEFNVDIVCDHDGFHITINNSVKYVFKHRHDYLTTDSLVIEKVDDHSIVDVKQYHPA